jgi:hypothetical protein
MNKDVMVEGNEFEIIFQAIHVLDIKEKWKWKRISENMLNELKVILPFCLLP